MSKLGFNLQFNDDFVGYEPNLQREFLPGDSLEMFKNNLNLMPHDWYYRDKKITYSFNDLGHRSRFIKDINFNNYILFVGCSHSFGFGLELETTYPYLVSQTLGMDYYNLAVCGSGADISFYNLVTWFSKFDKPKLIVFQQPAIARFMLLDESRFDLVGLWSLEDNKYENLKNFYNAALDMPYFETKALLYNKLIASLYKDVPIINFMFQYDGYKQYKYQHLDYFNILGFIPNTEQLARDNMHSGVQDNIRITNLIVEKYNNYE